MKSKLLIGLALLFTLQQSNTPEGWDIFLGITYEWRYFEIIEEQLLTPVFDEELRSMEGKEISLSGYFIPLELDSSFILSALPYSSCFFCGGGGAETVAQINIYPVPDDFEPDQFIKVKGKLKLNDTDLDYMNLILEESKILND